jgi:hypothetical protein
MNILLHTTTAITIAATTIGKSEFLDDKPIVPTLKKGLFVFLAAFISHAALDFIPHCYPLPAKIDVIVSLAVFGLFLFRIQKEFRIFMILAFVGGIFPDLIDLGPAIIGKYTVLSFGSSSKVFPWHWEGFSGSIYNFNCAKSYFYLACLLLVCAIMWLIKWKDITNIFKRRIL